MNGLCYLKACFDDCERVEQTSNAEGAGYRHGDELPLIEHLPLDGPDVGLSVHLAALQRPLRHRRHHTVTWRLPSEQYCQYHA